MRPERLLRRFPERLIILTENRENLPKARSLVPLTKSWDALARLLAKPKVRGPICRFMGGCWEALGKALEVWGPRDLSAKIQREIKKMAKGARRPGGAPESP